MAEADRQFPDSLIWREYTLTNSLFTQTKAKMAEAVCNNGAMDRAKEELKSTLTGYLTAMYGDEVKITFKDID